MEAHFTLLITLVVKQTFFEDILKNIGNLTVLVTIYFHCITNKNVFHVPQIKNIHTCLYQIDGE